MWRSIEVKSARTIISKLFHDFADYALANGPCPFANWVCCYLFRQRRRDESCCYWISICRSEIFQRVKKCSVLLEKSKLSGVAASFPSGLYNFKSNPKQIRFKSMQFLLSDVTKKSS